MAKKRSSTRRSGTTRSSGGKRAARRSGARKPGGRKSAGSSRRSSAATRTTAARGGERNRARRAARGQRKRPSGPKLSRSTTRAKWITSVQDHEDRQGQTLATRDHDVIRRWAEERGAEPAAATRGTGGRARVLRFDFPGYGGANLESVSWEEWFRTFDERDLVFLFQEHVSNGRTSNFFRLDNPQREAA